jgi:hypothetical protein
MNNLNRLSRRERRRLTANRKAPLALALAILLLLLILGNTQWPRIERFFGSDDAGQIQALADSIAIQAAESFNLSDSSYTDSLINQLGGAGGNHAIRRIRQPWPRYLPFEFYVQRLRELSRDKGLTCDCVESGEEKYLFCTIGSPGFVGSQVIVEPQRGTKLSGREIAFVFRNLGDLSDGKIMEMIGHDIAFSYFASPDIYPSVRTKKALEKTEVSSIIELPTDISDLPEFGSGDGQPSSKNKPNRENIDYRELAKSLFGRHPHPGAIFFKRSNGLDSAFVRSAIEFARETKTAYLYENPEPDEIDSLAYSSGLIMISMKSVADFRNSAVGEIAPLILHDLISSSIPYQNIVLLDASILDVEEFIDLHNTLRRLGVNVLTCISLAEVRESL